MTLKRLHQNGGNRNLDLDGRHPSLAWTGIALMLRVLAVVGAGLALAACSSSDTPDWLKADSYKLDVKPAPIMDTVRFESTPPGAEAKVSNGQTCTTPCALALPANASYSVTYTLAGHVAATEKIAPVSMGDGTAKLRPNPVLVEWEAAPAMTKPAKKPRARRSAAKPAPKPRPKPAAAAPAPAPAPAQPAAPSPWPAPQPTR